MRFYGTFGQAHELPSREFTIRKLKDYYVVVYGIGYAEVHLAMMQKFGLQWSHLYSHEEFDKSYFPGGKLLELGIKSAEDEAEEIIERIYEQRTINRQAERARDNNEELLPKE